MKPRRQTVICLVMLGLMALSFALIEKFWPNEEEVTLSLKLLWQGLCGLMVGLLIIDWVLRGNISKIEMKRELPSSLSQGKPATMTLTIKNQSWRSISVKLLDVVTEHIQSDAMPMKQVLEKNKALTVQYPILPISRGQAEWTEVLLEVRSLLGFWSFQKSYELPDTSKVYPSLTALHQLAKLGVEKHVGLMGVHLQQRRGQGLEFHQLREFREGDSLRQVDWRASSAHLKPISREYQDERNQEVIFLMDCGRRMRAKDGVASHFDQALEAMLLLSYVALKQGDGVGMLSFAGETRWLSPMKGQKKINVLLNAVYDMQSGTDTSDFTEVAQTLIKRHRKRSLIVLLTKVREEDQQDLMACVRLLSQTHLVLIASLKEDFIGHSLQEGVSSFSEALIYSGAIEVLHQEKWLANQLARRNVHLLNTTPQRLYVDLVNQYMAIKRSGLL